MTQSVAHLPSKQMNLGLISVFTIIIRQFHLRFCFVFWLYETTEIRKKRKNYDEVKS